MITSKLLIDGNEYKNGHESNKFYKIKIDLNRSDTNIKIVSSEKSSFNDDLVKQSPDTLAKKLRIMNLLNQSQPDLSDPN